ncbi:MAG: methyltransferase domain-containing protein [Candidatus Aenigmarchaeota archaeon]|nr:methyltransferase domain-containing protein [Candidatus Aenigmarchaeota archaeon]
MDEETAKIQKRYNRIAKFYDIFELFGEKVWFYKWRKKFISPLKGKILEIGIGTGKNIDFYNREAIVTGIDFSKDMLNKAQEKLEKAQKKNITLKQMDVENLEFTDNSFDYVVTSFVFCSVPKPIKGLKEIKRVLKPTGKLIMIEHILSKNTILAFIENTLNLLVKYIMGVNINRDTKQNIIDVGFIIVEDKNLALVDIFRLFRAKK